MPARPVCALVLIQRRTACSSAVRRLAICLTESPTPGILRYYQERAEAHAARAKNPDMPELAPDDYLERIYEAELRRLEALEK